jgi:hypothetical protein
MAERMTRGAFAILERRDVIRVGGYAVADELGVDARPPPQFRISEDTPEPSPTMKPSRSLSKRLAHPARRSG